MYGDKLTLVTCLVEKMSMTIHLNFSHRRIGVASHQSCSTPISRTGTVPPLSIPARTFRLIPAKTYDGKITQAIPPPPPYHASVRNALRRNEINQITTQIQQSCSTNVFNVSASSSSTLTTNINALNASNSAMCVDRNATKSVEPTEFNQTESDDFEANNNMNSETVSESINPDDCDENELVNQSEASSERAVSGISKQRPKQNGSTATDINHKEQRNPFKEENSDAAVANADFDVDVDTEADTSNANSHKTRGLKVLSNVQVSPNAILNVSLNSTNNEPIPLNNMIIVSSIPSTSTGTTSLATSTQANRPQSLLKCLNDTRTASTASTSSDYRNSKHTKVNVDVSVFFNFSFSIVLPVFAVKKIPQDQSRIIIIFKLKF